jgi:hypothetical protein
VAAAAAEAGYDRDAVAPHSHARTFEGLAAQLGKGQALDRRWTIIGLFISAVLRGSVTGRDPQAPSTLWIMIIRQHRRNSMLHSASRLGFVLLVTLRW